MLWLDVHGLGDGAVLKQIAQRYRISPLAMENLVNVPQRPKSEMFENHQLVISHCLVVSDNDKASLGQIGMILGKNFLLTFHQDCDHVLAPIHDRIENPTGRMRSRGPDYLLYAILDSCVDGCFPFLEGLGETIESLEQEALGNPHPDLLSKIHTAKNLLSRVRRSIWPQREMVLGLLTGESHFLADDTRTYLQNTADHCNQLADVVDMYREATSGLVNTYMSSVAHRSNEVMKVLTLLTSVFVPPTFLAGVYGMNFSEMPELRFPHAYPIALGLMMSMVAGTILYFYRRGWLTSAPIAPKSASPAPAPALPSTSAMKAAQNIVMEADFDHPYQRAA